MIGEHLSRRCEAFPGLPDYFAIHPPGL